MYLLDCLPQYFLARESKFSSVLKICSNANNKVTITKKIPEKQQMTGHGKYINITVKNEHRTSWSMEIASLLN